jgi:hypothetical protein
VISVSRVSFHFICCSYFGDTTGKDGGRDAGAGAGAVGDGMGIHPTARTLCMLEPLELTMDLIAQIYSMKSVSCL